MKKKVENLTYKETKVLTLVANGYQNWEIAKILSISKRTVESHRVRIMKKLRISNIAGLVKYAIKHDLTSTDHHRPYSDED